MVVCVSRTNYVLPRNFCFYTVFIFIFFSLPTSYYYTKPPSAHLPQILNRTPTFLKYEIKKFLTEFKSPSISFSTQHHQLSITSPPPSMVWLTPKDFFPHHSRWPPDNNVITPLHPSACFHIWRYTCTFKWIDGCCRLIVLRWWVLRGEWVKEWKRRPQRSISDTNVENLKRKSTLNQSIKFSRRQVEESIHLHFFQLGWIKQLYYPGISRYHNLTTDFSHS